MLKKPKRRKKDRLDWPDVIDPDGIPVYIEWETFDIGKKVFLPTVFPMTARRQLKAVADRRGIVIKAELARKDKLIGLVVRRLG